MLLAVGARSRALPASAAGPHWPSPPADPQGPRSLARASSLCVLAVQSQGRIWMMLTTSRVRSLWGPFLWRFYYLHQHAVPEFTFTVLSVSKQTPRTRILRTTSTPSSCCRKIRLRSLRKCILRRLQYMLPSYSSSVNHESNNCLLLCVINDRHNFTKIVSGLSHLYFVLSAVAHGDK